MLSVDNTFISTLYIQIKSLYSEHRSDAASCREINHVWHHTIISILISFTYPRICKQTPVQTENNGPVQNLQQNILSYKPSDMV